MRLEIFLISDANALLDSRNAIDIRTYEPFYTIELLLSAKHYKPQLIDILIDSLIL